MSNRKYKYLFGPVPSRRLGRSLGVDIVPLKTCTQNCIYCQLGRNAATTVERKEYVPIEAVLAELEQKIADGLEADTITVSGSGEPTLHTGLGDLIDGIHTMTGIPVAVITNGTLLSDPEVRDACAKAEIVLPSLDAGDAETFEKMNRPDPNLDFDRFVNGLVEFAKVYTGKLWLEVFFCDGVNTDETSISNLKTQIDRIGPDKIQLNTSVRPVVDSLARRVEEGKLKQIAQQLGPRAEVIADFSKARASTKPDATEVQILDMLGRRPCRLADVCNGLGIQEAIAFKLLEKLISESKITLDQDYYKLS